MLDLTAAEALVARTKAAIDEHDADARALRGPFRSVTPHALRRSEVHRRLLDDALDGLRAHAENVDADWRHQRPVWPCADAQRYSRVITEIADLYGERA